jgi:hypothetical protein
MDSLNFSRYFKISKLLCIYPTISRPNPTYVLRNSSPLRNPSWETLVQGAGQNVYKRDLKPRKMGDCSTDLQRHTEIHR